MQYLSPSQYAQQNQVSRQRVMQWLAGKRIAGARTKNDPMGRKVWMIPASASRPAKEKTGRKPCKNAGK